MSIYNSDQTDSNLDKQQSKIVVKIQYLPIRGLIQPIRMLLNYLKVDYVDTGINKDEQSNNRINANFVNDGFRIYLDDLIIGDVVSACRYLCFRFNKKELLGRNAKNEAQINEIMTKYYIQKNKMLKTIFKGIRQISSNTDKRSEILWSTFRQILQQSSYIHACLKFYRKSRNFLIGYLTILDFFFYEACFYLVNFFGSLINIHPLYGSFLEFKEFIETNQFYKENKLQIQMQKIFLPIENQERRAILEEIWEDKNFKLF